jgi:hypothetical protein
MNIKFKPVNCCNRKLESLSVQGSSLIINGETLELNDYIGVGQTDLDEQGNLFVLNDLKHEYLKRCDPDLNVTVLLPHGTNAPESTRFPEPIENVQDGDIAVPDYEYLPLQAVP